ncbi:MAG: ribokinase [Clostridia bacterium]|nr:ribokinase [Clostridia bacterium]
MRILNFGSLNIDYVYSVPHILRPGETLAATKMERFAGGKGSNQTVALARAGAAVWHAGCIGADGGFLREMHCEAGVHTEFLRTVAGPTGSTVIQVEESGENCIIYYPGANHRITPKQIAETLADFAKGDILLLQNEINAPGEIIRAAKERGMKIFFNPSPITEAVKEYPLELVDCFLVNEIEAAELAGADRDPAVALAEKYPDAEIVMTLGKRGALWQRGETRIAAEGFSVRAVDTTGAGDTFTGYYLKALCDGLPTAAALRRACAAAAIAVGRMGAAAAIPAATEVDAFFAERR